MQTAQGMFHHIAWQQLVGRLARDFQLLKDSTLEFAQCQVQRNRQQGFAAGLYLPTSDIDLVVMDSKSADVRTALYAVSRKLSERKIARDVQVGL